MNSRLKNIYAALEQKNLDGLIVSGAANISYLTKYPSRDSYLLASKKENIYFTDSRYLEEASLPFKGTATLTKVNGSVFGLIADACLSLGLERIGFEERHLSYAEHKKIRQGLNKKGDLVPTHNIIEAFRQIKEPEELVKIREAVRITARAFKFIQGFIKKGAKELEIVGELERFIRQAGATGSSFDIIVGAGPNSSLPHHISSPRRIRKDEPVLLDMGVDYMGYKSDLTRVFFLDKISTLNQKVYNIVLGAQERAIGQIRPGKKIAEIDAAARQYITEKGYGSFFGHSLGHGIGLEVHEEPHISAKDNSLLEPGEVFTIEPAIYFPGKFGVRIEDMVLVTEKGCEVLSGFFDK